MPKVSNLVYMMRCWTSLHQVHAQVQNIWKPGNQRTKQDSQHRLRGKNLRFNNNYMILWIQSNRILSFQTPLCIQLSTHMSIGKQSWSHHLPFNCDINIFPIMLLCIITFIIYIRHLGLNITLKTETWVKQSLRENETSLPLYYKRFDYLKNSEDSREQWPYLKKRRLVIYSTVSDWHQYIISLIKILWFQLAAAVANSKAK